MRKLRVVIIALLLGIVALLGIAGCSGTQSELRGKIAELQNRIEEMEERIEQLENKITNVRGKYYLLQTAYDNGWLNEDDLKSIACYYNDFQKKDNPYSGMYVPPAEGLSEDVENELKQAYLNQIAEYPDGLLENVQINYYYGTYNGNIIIKIRSYYIFIEPIEKEEFYIGNVVFKSYWDAQTWVYHID